MTTPSPSPVTSADLSFDADLGEIRRSLALLAERPADEVLVRDLQEHVVSAARKIAALRPGDRQHPWVQPAFSLMADLSGAGLTGWPVRDGDIVLADQLRHKGWSGLVASMLIVPACQTAGALPLGDVPSWMWGDYAKWALLLPRSFVTAGQLEKAARGYSKFLEDVATWGTRNRGSAAVHTALEAFLASESPAALDQAPGSLRAMAESRAKALKAALGLGIQSDISPTDCSGRRLRVGVLHSCFDANAATFALMPWFVQLDRDNFEVVLFAESSVSSAVEERCRAAAWEFQILPLGLQDQADCIRAANLDALLFADDLTGPLSNSFKLSLQRLAPLQIATTASPVTTGSPEVDLYLTGEMTEKKGTEAHYTERLALVPGPADFRDFESDKTEAAMEWTRGMVGAPDDAVIFISSADHRKIGPETRESWVEILAAVPGSRLLLHPFRSAEDVRADGGRLAALFDRLLAAKGVPGDHLAIVTEPFASRADVKAFLRVGNVFLDTVPVSGTGSVIDAFEVGLPVVTRTGSEARTCRAAVLAKALELDALVAADADSYERIAVRLAGDRAERTAWAEKLRSQLTHTPIFKDGLVASEMFGLLVRKAYEQLLQAGRSEFRRSRDPISVHSAGTVAPEMLNAVEAATLEICRAPTSWTARHAMGIALRDAGRIGHATKYLVAALEGGENHAPLWRDLAVTLRSDGKRNQAIEALETCLRIDPKQGDVWAMAIELAEASGALDLAREMLEALRGNVPDYPQTPLIAARLGC